MLLVLVRDVVDEPAELLQGRTGAAFLLEQCKSNPPLVLGNALERTIQGKPTSLFVNVNRGILIEERGGLRSVSDWTAEPLVRRLAGSMVGWLASPSDPADGLGDILRPSPEKLHY